MKRLKRIRNRLAALVRRRRHRVPAGTAPRRDGPSGPDAAGGTSVREPRRPGPVPRTGAGALEPRPEQHIDLARATAELDPAPPAG